MNIEEGLNAVARLQKKENQLPEQGTPVSDDWVHLCHTPLKAACALPWVTKKAYGILEGEPVDGDKTRVLISVSKEEWTAWLENEINKKPVPEEFVYERFDATARKKKIGGGHEKPATKTYRPKWDKKIESYVYDIEIQVHKPITIFNYRPRFERQLKPGLYKARRVSFKGEEMLMIRFGRYEFGLNLLQWKYHQENNMGCRATIKGLE